MPKFSANIIYLFNEVDLINRVQAAAEAGFLAVECQRPFNIPPQIVRDMLKEFKIEMVLINTPISPASPNNNGIAVYPDLVDAFQEITENAINYAVSIRCTRLHVVAGQAPENLSRLRAEDTFLSNLQWAGDLGLKNGIKILIEPLNRTDKPGYFLSTAAQAAQLLTLADHDNLYLQYDLYHAGMNGEDVIDGARRYLDMIDHIQMAGVPNRHEPNTGNIDMMAAFEAIDDMGYVGWIGAEYIPTHSTLEGLSWGASYGIGVKPLSIENS